MTETSAGTSAALLSPYQLTGPTSLSVGAKATYTLTPPSGTTLTSAVTVTPACTLAGTFAPSSVVLAAGSTSSVAFTFTPTTAGSGTLATTNSGGLTDPNGISVFAIALSTAFTTFTLTGPTSLVVGTPATYAVTPGSGTALASAVTITPSCTLSGTFSPTSVTIPAGSTAAATFTFIPSESGAGTVSVTNTGGLSNPSDLFVTSNASAPIYTAYGISGPRSVLVGTPATYTLTPGTGAAHASAITLTPDCTLAGTFSPSRLTFAAGSTAPVTFTFTASAAGNGLMSVSNSATLTDPASFTLTALSGAASTALPVDCESFLFSPGNWSGDAGRRGSGWRRTWNVGAWLKVVWLASATPTATLHLGPSGTGAYVTMFLNGTAMTNLSAQGDITLSGITAGQVNTLEVFLTRTPDSSRWNGGANCLSVSGMTLDAASSLARASISRSWGKIVGDDLAEGIAADDGADNVLCAWPYLVLRAMDNAGYDTCISASADSGYLTPGDSTKDVPAFHVVAGSSNGMGGAYNDSLSRWNRIDAGISALDSDGMLSSYGDAGTAPSWVAFNLLANDAAASASTSDATAAMTHSLVAHRAAAPDAWLFPIMPFAFHDASAYGSSWAQVFNSALSAYQLAYPDDEKVVAIDVGARLSLLLRANPGLYTTTDGKRLTAEGHAVFASIVSGAILAALGSGRQRICTFY
ncbi:hypothetical protein AA0472_0464 [Acetobacter estunensis NRIC 0472]|uniref:Uncharacterized protein n=1 Tax=Acetobacter estunensis TaxID=104097 RepID=A0A967EDM3_9PROT|nr:hypothetical protein [Acetobacter estunensis]NHO54160.1 hypothetical protein [Acetobacter estunensis]GBQ21478.1 hypothetical protein AA0472_0464 [Acetobacter estunensis NRIC 0472]